MTNKLEEIVKKLTKENKTISTMESCTGGGFVNAITNIEGASEVLKFSAVTYSNEYKIKMGVDKDIIDFDYNGTYNYLSYAVYDKDNDKYYTMSIEMIKSTRKENKELIINMIASLLLNIL